MRQNQRMKEVNARFNFRTMLVLVAGVPLIFALISVVWVVRHQFDELAQAQSELVQPIFLQARKDEIRNFVQLGRRAVAQMDTHNAEVSKHEALALLRRMDLGEDSYFFVYDLQGNSLMHPRLSELEGFNHWEMRDSSGSLIIQKLIIQAKAGGGFVDYMWNRPSTGREEHKLGYVEIIPEFGWMVGTGLYLDHLKETQAVMLSSTRAAMETTRNQILWIASAALLLVTGGGLLLNLREQRSANAKLRVMAQRVVTSQEDERTRVSRELHDGISQTLAAVKFSVETSMLRLTPSHPELASQLKNSSVMMKQVMQDVRRISHNLRPSVLDDLDLCSAISQLAREFGERTNTLIELSLGKLPQLPESIATAIFRVTQEALSNIDKHAKAHRIKIELQHSHNSLTLFIQDDGCGFDLQGTLRHLRSGLGLTNMQERIEMLGGRYSLESTSNGTSLSAEIPLPTDLET